MATPVTGQTPQVVDISTAPSLKVERTLLDRIATVFLTVITLGFWIPFASNACEVALKKGDVDGAKKWLKLQWNCCVDGTAKLVNELAENKHHLCLKFLDDNELVSKDKLLRVAILKRDDVIFATILQKPDLNTKPVREFWNYLVEIITDKREGTEGRKKGLEIAAYLISKNFTPLLPNFDGQKWIEMQGQKIDKDVIKYPYVKVAA